MKIIILLLFLTSCSVHVIEPIEQKTITVQVMDLDNQTRSYTIPIYSKLSVILDKLDCQTCDMTRFNPDMVLKQNDIIILYPISDKRISINQASLEELESLPGIGPSIASKIIEYRNKNGFFQTLEDIMLIKGIKLSIFNKIKDLIRL